MRPWRDVARLALLGLVAVQAACTSPNPRLYTIASVPAAISAGTPKVISLRQIGLARYLERDQIVRSSEGYRLDVLSNDWWGEPLGAMLARVLANELGQRLPRSSVYVDTGAVSVPSDATVELNVTRLDLNAAGTLVLQAQAAITTKGRTEPLIHDFDFAVPPPNTTVPGEVAAISTAVGQLADGLATMLASGRNPK